MSEQERIKQMVKDGKISQQEADLLLEALDDIDQVDGEIGSTLEPSETVPERDLASTPSSENLPPPPTPPKPPAAPAAGVEDSADAKARLNWVRIEMLAGDLEVRVDETLTEPKIEGKVETSRDGNNFVIKQERQKNFLGGLLSMMDNHLDITVPAGYGIDLHSKAGDIDIRDVPFFAGELLSGDIHASDLGGVDLELKAGDLDISLRLTEGAHRIDALAGDIDIKILPGSDVRIEGNLLAGSSDLRGPFNIERKMVGNHFTGVVGKGTATLDIRVKAGDVDVEVAGE